MTCQDQDLSSIEHIVALVLEHGTTELADAFSPRLNLGMKVEFSRALANEPSESTEARQPREADDGHKEKQRKAEELHGSRRLPRPSGARQMFLPRQTFPNAMISATLHATPMNIRSATFQISAPDLASCPVSDLPEFAFIGRSNVGKSSLLNMLAGQKSLAKVSATPGHTHLINFFSMDNTWSLVDLPGYGFAKAFKAVRDRFQEMIAGYLSARSNLACVFVLIDSRHKPQQIDLDFVQWLMDGGTPMALVFTKTDMTKASEVAKNIGLFGEHISGRGLALPVIFTSSATTKSGRAKLLAFIGKSLRIKLEPVMQIGRRGY